MRLLAIAAALGLAALGANGAASDQGVSLLLTVFPCANDSAAPPALRAWAMKKLAPEVPVVPAWEHAGATWQGTMTLEAGAYIFTADSPHCSSGEARWIAIPGAQRHFAITLNKVKSMTLDAGTAYGSVSGFLPAPAATVEVFRAGETGQKQLCGPVPTDGNTYQLVFLRPGRYVVRIAFGDVAVNRTLTIGRTIETLTVRADLTADDAASIVRQQAAGSHFVYAVDGEHVRHTTLQLGAATANGWTTASPSPPSENH